MRRVLLTLLALSIAAPAAYPCGNKFLVWKRLAKRGQLRGSSDVPRVLIFRNKSAPHTKQTSADPELRSTLKAFGLKVDTADTDSKLEAQLAKRSYDLVVADFADAGVVAQKVRSAASQAAVLPVLLEPSRTDTQLAMEQYQGWIGMPSEPDALITAIVDAVARQAESAAH